MIPYILVEKLTNITDITLDSHSKMACIRIYKNKAYICLLDAKNMDILL